jgi:hypothetical protein
MVMEHLATPCTLRGFAVVGRARLSISSPQEARL